MIEIWKDIEGFENKYQISNFGRIKSLNYNNTNKERILKPKINQRNGILEIKLSYKNKTYDRQVARLVIETFLNIKLGRNDIVMHKDSKKENCNIYNLYIISRGKRQELTYDLEKRYVPKYEYYGKMKTIKELSKVNNIDPETIRSRLKL